MAKKLRAFIASSTEALEFALAVQSNLHDCLECTVWPQDSFQLSDSILTGLVAQACTADFGIFLFMPDDVSTIRDEQHMTVRDNVLFELGLFAGKLGTERTFIVHPCAPAIRFPSDLAGITTAMFELERADRNWEAALGPACARIRRRVKELGPHGVKVAPGEGLGNGQYVAAVCFRKEGPAPEFLLVRSTRGRRIFPKGWIKLGETLEDAALRYAHTEGGSFGGVISKEHMVFRYFKEEARKEILVTAVLVESTSCVETRAPFREPTWFGIEAAETSLSIERDYEYTEELRKVLRWAYSKVQIRTCKQIKVGVIPFRTNGRDIEVLLITSKTHHRWILPKGNMQAGLSAEASALEEALQEAGIEGELVGESLGVHDYSRLGVPHTLEAFPMRVTKTHNDWPEKPARERRWVNIERAATIVEYEHLKQIFVEFQKRVVKNKTKNRHKRGTEAA